MISNVEFKEMAPSLFAHTGSLVVPAMFAGRKNEMERLLQHVESAEQGSVLVVSEPLGTGKTTFLKNAGQAMSDRGLLAREREENAIVGIRELSDEYMSALSPAEVMVLDEVDRKQKRHKAMDKLGLVNERLGEGFSQLILSGDQSLTDREDLREALGNASCFKWLGLEALSSELLFEALARRARYYKEGDEQIGKEVEDVFDPAFLRRLLPDTEPPVATFRETLKLLTELVASPGGVPLNTLECRLSGESCHAWLAELPPATEDRLQVEFLLWLSAYLSSLERERKAFKALSTEEWFDLCPLNGIDGPEEYEERILDPLARGDVLRSFGIPFVEGTGEARRDPGPYAPSVKTFLRTAFDPAWP